MKAKKVRKQNKDIDLMITLNGPEAYDLMNGLDGIPYEILHNLHCQTLSNLIVILKDRFFEHTDSTL